jgi:hypothetical protein
MKKFWGYLSVFLAGAITGLIAMLLLLRNKISNDSIEINRPKIKNSPGGNQDFNSELKTSVKTLSDRKLKRKARQLTNKLKQQAS